MTVGQYSNALSVLATNLERFSSSLPLRLADGTFISTTIRRKNRRALAGNGVGIRSRPSVFAARRIFPSDRCGENVPSGQTEREARLKSAPGWWRGPIGVAVLTHGHEGLNE